MTAVTRAGPPAAYLFVLEKSEPMRGLGPNFQSVFAATVMVVTIAALVFWIMGAAPSLD